MSLFSLPPGVRCWLRLLLVALPELSVYILVISMHMQNLVINFYIMFIMGMK